MRRVLFWLSLSGLAFGLIIVVSLWLGPLTMRGIRDRAHGLGIHVNGHVSNRSGKPLWVISSSNNHLYAYVLRPGYRSPDSLDADAVKSMDGSPINGDTTWHKVIDGGVADVIQLPGGLSLSCLLCYTVHEQEFHQLIYKPTQAWGE
ncbi:hypothetical protein [Spirosoma fluminis]